MYKAISFIYFLLPVLCPMWLAIIVDLWVKTYYLNNFFFSVLGQHSYRKRS